MRLLYLIAFLIMYVQIIASGHTKFEHACAFSDAFAKQDIVLWYKAMKELDNDHKIDIDPDLMEIKLLGYYGAVAWHIREQEDTAKMYTDSIDLYLKYIENIPELRTQHEMISVSNAFFKAYLYPWLSPYYAGLAYYNLSTNDQDILNSPYYWAELGNSKYHVPNYLGRDYQLSAKYYARSRELADEQGNINACNWYYLNTMLWQARSLQKGKNVSKAIVIYKEILEFSPQFDTIQRIINILDKDSTARF